NVSKMYVGGVAKNQAGQVDGRRRAVDGTGEVMFQQQWQSPGVIEVRMSQQDGVERTEARCRRNPVTFLGSGRALEQAAIDEHTSPVCLDEVSRSSDFAAGGPVGDDSYQGSHTLSNGLGINTPGSPAIGTFRARQLGSTWANGGT